MPKIKKEKKQEQPVQDNTLSSLSENLSNAEKVLDEFNLEKENQETKVRKKRTKKSEPEIDERSLAFTGTATFSMHIAFNMLLKRMPKDIPLSVDESKNLDEAFTNLANKYYPYITKFGEEITFLTCVVFILVPRIDFDKNKKQDTEKS